MKKVWVWISVILFFNSTIRATNILQGFDFKKWLTYIPQNSFNITHQDKRRWQENYFVATVNNKKILNSIFLCHNPSIMYMSVLLSRIEEVGIFQKVIVSNPIEYKLLRKMEFFDETMLIKTFRSVVKTNPFFIYLTNHPSSKSPEINTIKYAFNNIYNKNPWDKKILVLTVANNLIENQVLLSSLFSNKKKLLLLHSLVDIKNHGYFFKENISYFLTILGPPLHHIVFSDGRSILFYGDINRCIHNENQNINFAIFFDKNLNLNFIQVNNDYNLCDLCLYDKINNLSNDVKIFNQQQKFHQCKASLLKKPYNTLDFFFQNHPIFNSIILLDNLPLKINKKLAHSWLNRSFNHLLEKSEKQHFHHWQWNHYYRLINRVFKYGNNIDLLFNCIVIKDVHTNELYDSSGMVPKE